MKLFVSGKKYQALEDELEVAENSRDCLRNKLTDTSRNLDTVSRERDQLKKDLVKSELKATNILAEVKKICVPKMTKAEIKRTLSELPKSFK